MLINSSLLITTLKQSFDNVLVEMEKKDGGWL